MKDEKFNKIQKIIELYKKGSMIIVTDDEDRENEGDLMISSEKISVEDISFMARYGRGLICVAIEDNRASQLQLPLMTSGNDSPFSTAFTVSVDAAKGTTTGISASDRFKTIKTIIDPKSVPEDLLRPGHMFPLIAAKGGLLERSGHTEAAVELGRLVGHASSGVICEIMGDDGTMVRGEDLQDYAMRFELPILTIKELKDYLYNTENREATFLPTDYGDFNLYCFPSSLCDEMPHIALVHKEIDRDKAVNLRVHSECLTGDLFGSLRCDCGNQLKQALERINESKGVLIYMRQEGRGIGLNNKMEAYRLQDRGFDTVEANLELGFLSDERNYEEASQIIKSLGITRINLMTNNPDKISSLESYGIIIENRISLEIESNVFNVRYLKTKKEKMNHLLSV
ncbi:MAG: 3,4-dihydroxy-2-butanone-4-phosphate synthase [Spirochaetaceae bacterium]|nr:3,4-dihydroxy-2-butanone-4-phosphate synthase [Spirochaetaceae bacterium]